MTSLSSRTAGGRGVTLPPAVLDGGWATTALAEHAVLTALSRAGAAVAWAATHFHGGRVLVTADAAVVDVRDLGHLRADTGALVPDHLARTSGRVFVFPGSQALPDRTDVATVLACTAVDLVLGIGGQEVDPATTLLTQGFVRPTWEGGRLVLRVRPAVGGVVPFEQPNPTPCCAGHGPA